MFRAAAAFANQVQFWKDFSFIFNTDLLKQRRAGLKYNVQEAELAQIAAGGDGNTVKACTEEYNGTAWSPGGNLITGRDALAGAGR